MSKSLTKYMLIDLAVLSVIGFVLEMFLIKFSSFVFLHAPACAISLLIVFIAVVRWNLYGLITVPIMCLSVHIGGQMVSSPVLSAVYDWKFLLANMISMLSIGINVIFFKHKKIGTKRIVNSLGMLGLMALDYVVYCLLFLLIYRLLTAGTLAHSGLIEFTFNGQTFNLCYYGERGLVDNLLGLALLAVGGYVLRSQGIICNVKQKFIDDKYNAELDRKDREEFRIKSVEEEAEGESDSSKEEKNENSISD